MSIEEARDRVTTLAYELADEGHVMRRDYEAALDELIREVKASLPCYRAWDDTFPGEPMCDHGPGNCPTCQARAEKVGM